MLIKMRHDGKDGADIRKQGQQQVQSAVYIPRFDHNKDGTYGQQHVQSAVYAQRSDHNKG